MNEINRVVITGIGIISSLGVGAQANLYSLQNAISGIKSDQSHIDFGFKSQISGMPPSIDESKIDRKLARFMGQASKWIYLSFLEALQDSNLSQEEISHPDIGLIVGSGGPSTSTIIEAADKLRLKKSPRTIGATAVPKAMSSTLAANLSVPFKIKGINYSISSACATSVHCIGAAYEQIKLGNQKIVFAGGGEDLHWSLSSLFDAMGAMSSKYNDTPASASKAYDINRDGFVISGGAGIVIVEDYEHAIKRGAKIYAEIVGYGATSDGFDMVAPSGEGAQRCMKLAMKNIGARKISYINTHGTATKIGDEREIEAIKKVFGNNIPFISSTKSLSGHCLGGAGVHETIFSLLMMKNRFLTKSAHIQELDPLFKDIPIITETIKNFDCDLVLNNSFGFGGTNGCLVLGKI